MILRLRTPEERIERSKTLLIEKAEYFGVYKGFGQIEIAQLKKAYATDIRYIPLIKELEEWVADYYEGQ